MRPELSRSAALNHISMSSQWRFSAFVFSTMSILTQSGSPVTRISKRMPSAVIDYDDWSLDHEQLLAIDQLWGPHTIDRFATDHSRQLLQFDSRYFYPGTTGVDAFAFNWAGANNWLCPPTSLIVAAVRHARTCQAKVTLLVPEWPSSYFWPFLFEDGTYFGRGITSWSRLPKPAFVPCRMPGSGEVSVRRRAAFQHARAQARFLVFERRPAPHALAAGRLCTML